MVRIRVRNVGSKTTTTAFEVQSIILTLQNHAQTILTPLDWDENNLVASPTITNNVTPSTTKQTNLIQTLTVPSLVPPSFISSKNQAQNHNFTTDIPPPSSTVAIPNMNKLYEYHEPNPAYKKEKLGQMKQNQDKIPTEIATQIEIAQCNQLNATLAVVVDVVSVPAKLPRNRGKHLGDSDEGRNNRSPPRRRD